MKFKVASILLVMVLTCTASAHAASSELGYGTHNISRTLQVNEDVAYVVSLEAGDKLVVNLEVVSGGPVDFYLTNITAYLAYKSSIASGVGVEYLYYIREYSKKSTGSISYEYGVLVKDTMVIIIDNTGWTEGGAEPVGEVTVDGTISIQKNVWTTENIMITALIIGIVVAFMVGVKLPKRKR